jgi:hypothetical protein
MKYCLNVKGVAGGVNNSKFFNKNGIERQGELTARLVFIGLFCVLDLAVCHFVWSKKVNKFEMKQQGELTALVVIKELVCVLDPAVNFDAPGPTRIILCLTKGFRREHLL